MRRVVALAIIVLQTVILVDANKSLSNKRQTTTTEATGTTRRYSHRSRNTTNSTSDELSDVSFRNITLKILPIKNSTNSSHQSISPVTSLPTTNFLPNDDSDLLDNATANHLSSQFKPGPVFTQPTEGSQGQPQPHFQCTATVPRMNLRLDKLLGIWYPIKFSQITFQLWSESFEKHLYNNSMPNDTNTSCFTLEYSTDNEGDKNLTAISLALHRAGQSVTLEAILVGDDKHPKGSKWAISWPNGEDTLTSVVAAGVVGRDKNQYSWLLTVDCDVNGIVESDWAVMARIPEGISNATLNAILAILGGLKGIKVEHAITFQSENCHK